MRIRYLRRAALLLTVPAALMTLASTARAQRYTNIVNDRFAAVTNGPQSSIVVDVASTATTAARRATVDRYARADWKSRAQSLAPQVALARRSGLLPGRGVLPISTLITTRQNSRLALPPVNNGRTRAVGNGTLTFRYTGWSAQRQQFLTQFAQAAYPRIQNVYGAPAWTGTVEIVNLGPLDSGTATDVQRLAFGAYDVTNGRILLPFYENVDTQAHALLLLMVHAFHGPAYFQFDAWEQGFARAVASIVARDPFFGFQDATANNLYSLLKFYDLLNQPTLGNPTFFPPSQRNLDLSSFGIGKMLLPRMGMAGAAWLKVYIENQAFFRNFNAAYYAQFVPGASPSLAGNTTSLRNFAAAAVRSGRTTDQVEGLAFNEWYERQYILDTSVSVGSKLYAFVLPFAVGTTGSQSASITLVYFRTKADADEDLLSGRGYATYFNYGGARITLGAAAELAEIRQGEGFLTTLAFPTAGSADSGRITLDFHAGTETVRSWIPSGTGGDFQGVVLGQTTGGLSVRQTTVAANPSVRNASSTLARGAVGVNLGTQDNDLATSVISITSGGSTTQYRRNTGDGQYYAVVHTDGSIGQETKVFPAGWNLVSFPLRPFQSNVATALGVNASNFLLSWFDPARSDYQTFSPAAPAISAIQPGRGYWLRVFPPAGQNAVTVRLTGVSPSRDTDSTVSLAYGWNLVGTPFAEGTDIRDLMVQYLQNDAVSWDTAVQNSLVSPTVSGYNPATNAYTTLTSNGGRLEQWQGYWVRVLAPSGVTLLFPGPDSPSRARLRR